MQEIREITLGDKRGIELANGIIFKSDELYKVIAVRKGEVVLHGKLPIKLFRDKWNMLPPNYCWLQLSSEAIPIAFRLPNIPFLKKLLFS
jgi:hypothetical protein